MTEPSPARYLVVSGCSYVGPPSEAYRAFVDPRHRDDFERWVSSGGGDTHGLPNHVIGGGSLYGDDYLDPLLESARDRMQAAGEPRARIDEMDAQGIAAE